MLPFDSLMTETQLQNIFCGIISRQIFYWFNVVSSPKKISNPGELKCITKKKIIFLLCMKLPIYNLFQGFRALKL